jgi:ABC-type amino acid transport system permease subunit
MAATADVPRDPRSLRRTQSGRGLVNRALRWLRANLFSSVANSLTTLVLLALLIKGLAGLAQWGIWNAVWETPGNDSSACRAVRGVGACWAVIPEKYRFVELIRGVPLISLLFMASVMFPLFMPGGFNIDKLLRAQIAIVLFAGAYLAEVIRGGLQAVPRGQHEAADALGLSYWRKNGLIILPQAIRHVIPPLVNTFIAFFKDTSLVLIIGIFDLLTTAKTAIIDPVWQQFSVEVYLFVATIYFAFCFAMSRFSRRL